MTKKAQLIRVYEGPRSELKKLEREVIKALRAFDRAQRKMLAVALRPKEPLEPLLNASIDLCDARKGVQQASRKLNRYRVRVRA